MENLLTKQEHRWFYFVEKLTMNNDWMILADLASLLDCSKRILKMDIRYFNETFDDFIIHTSNKGVKIEYHPNKSFKTFCQKLLIISDTYRLLELIFLNENIKVKDVSKQLDISLSTLYRMIDQLNLRTEEDFGFIIETGPCRIVGDEERIRLFFYTYFFEKYPQHNWPFEELDVQTLHALVQEMIQVKKLPYDFVYFNIVKIITLVNYTRYKNDHLVAFDPHDNELITLLLSSTPDNGLQDKIEAALNVDFDKDFISQILHPLIQPGIYQTHMEFTNALSENNELNQKIESLRTILTQIATKHNLPIPNLEMVLYILYNAASLEYSQPQSRHILYNQNGFFASEIKNQFPAFYESLYDGMKEFQMIMNKPTNESGINFYIFTVVSWWENLISELHQNIYKIKVLLVSDRHQKHAQMMKEFINFEFGEQLEIETINTIYLDSDLIDLSNYDLIISSYTDNRLQHYRTLFITNVPQPEDYIQIQKHIDSILADQMDHA